MKYYDYSGLFLSMLLVSVFFAVQIVFNIGEIKQLEQIIKSTELREYRGLRMLQKMPLISTEAPKEDKTINYNLESTNYWRISTYYTPVKGQLSYFLGSYEKDYNMNCSGDCFITASGYRLSENDKYKIASCPPWIPLDTRLEVSYPDGNKIMLDCQDYGSAIIGKRLDVWVGYGEVGKRYQDSVWIGKYSSKQATVKILN